MDRKDFIKYIAVLSGGVFIGSQFLLTSCENPYAGSTILTNDDLNLIDEVAEAIIPETQTPGAKSAKVTPFIKRVFETIYTEEEQLQLTKTLHQLNETAQSKYSNPFVSLSNTQKESVINQVKNPKDIGFVSLYQLVLYSYLSSEIGLTSTFRFNPVPGKYEANIPYNKGDKAYVNLQFIF